MDEQLTEHAIANALFLELNAATRAIAPNYTPRRWFECDIFSITKAGYFVEHEIKRTISDFKADAKKKAPWQGRYKHERLAQGDPYGPSRFFYVVPEGLLEPDEVPEWAGLKIIRPWRGRRSPVIRLKKAAPFLHRQKLGDVDAVVRQIQRCMYNRYWWHRVRAAKGFEAEALEGVSHA